MPDLNTKKNKHMSLDDRIEIQSCLDHAMTFKAIARRIGKDQTTISKEVKKHITVNPGETITRFGASGDPVVIQPCPLLLKAPFVCNACKKRRVRCNFQRQLYIAKNAHREYETLLTESREGIPLNKETFYEVDSILSQGIKKGQHLYHVIQTNNLGVSQATVYRHLHRGYLSVSKMDFPRVVKFKKRQQYNENYIPKVAKVGRTYDDFLSYVDENNLLSWVEMDTVIGRIGGKVTQKVRSLKERLSSNGVGFGDVFPLLLTDNGGEFSNVSAFTANADGEIESSLYFCDPFRSCQKPKVEKNHTLFRDIVPKGESFDSFTQETVDLIFSHVNNVKRKSLNGKSPYEMFIFTYGEKIASLLGISYVSADEVLQSPKLLKK